jgi:hypothetical protein
MTRRQAALWQSNARQALSDLEEAWLVRALYRDDRQTQRRIARHKGGAVAVFAIARKLSQLIYRMLRYGPEPVNDFESEATRLVFRKTSNLSGLSHGQSLRWHRAPSGAPFGGTVLAASSGRRLPERQACTHPLISSGIGPDWPDHRSR